MKYNFTDIFDIPVLTELCESFTAMNGVVTALLDLDGKIHIATGWKDICTQFHRTTPGTALRCTESDTALAKKLSEGRKYNLYRCKNGLVDVAVPIIIDDEHVANFFTGQFLLEKPDINSFIQQAQEFGFNQDEYLNALSRVPIFQEDEIKKITQFLVQLTELIGELGKKNLLRLEEKEKYENSLKQTIDSRTIQLQNANKLLLSSNERLEKKVQERVQDITELNQSLQEKVEEKEKNNRQLIYLNKELESFAYTVSHDLRAPLRSMHGFSELLRSKFSDKLDDKGQDYLNRIQTAATHMDTLIDDMLSLSLISRSTLKLTRVNISQLVTAVEYGQSLNPIKVQPFFSPSTKSQT